jgi:hypothetical protein
MIGTVKPANPAPPQYRAHKAQAPIYRVPRSLDLLGADPKRAAPDLQSAGRIVIRA